MNTMILTKAQAEAVYSAMCALNNIGARLTALTIDEEFRVAERVTGRIALYVSTGADWEPAEAYDSQSAFATAYGLQQG